MFQLRILIEDRQSFDKDHRLTSGKLISNSGSSGTSSNVAGVLFGSLIVTWQSPSPLQSPLQPLKVDPAFAEAFSVTSVPPKKLSLQLTPQEIPAALPAKFLLRGGQGKPNYRRVLGNGSPDRALFDLCTGARFEYTGV